VGIGHAIATGFVKQSHLNLPTLLATPPLPEPFFRMHPLCQQLRRKTDNILPEFWCKIQPLIHPVLLSQIKVRIHFSVISDLHAFLLNA
jgi:hypothetical protein